MILSEKDIGRPFALRECDARIILASMVKLREQTEASAEIFKRVAEELAKLPARGWRRKSRPRRFYRKRRTRTMKGK